MAESTRTSNFRGRTVSSSESSWSRIDVKSANNREQSQNSLPINTRSRNPRPCRFFIRGSCTRAECQFSHESPVTANSRHSPIRNINARRTITKNYNNGPNMPSTSSQSSSLNEASNSYNNEASAPSNSNSENNTLNNSRCEETDGAQEVSSPISKNDWVNAPEFVPSQPKQKSYAQAVNPMDSADFIKFSDQRLCPYVTKEGCCRYPPGECSNLHGDLCDLCGKAVMHPFNEELRKKHNQECIKQHEKDMELSFALARSKEKSCGVCFEIIMEKAIGEQRFGILPNCNHCFCLTCIRKWRQARQFENKIIRACPECRITSDFVCPSMYWVDTKEDKDKLIDDYKKALSKKDCKYFKKGSGKCPFGNKCFYLHAFPDGRICDVGPPPRQRRRRNFDHTDFDVLQHVILWDFLDDRANPWQSLADDLEDLVSFFSDSDDSDWFSQPVSKVKHGVNFFRACWPWSTGTPPLQDVSSLIARDIFSGCDIECFVCLPWSIGNPSLLDVSSLRDIFSGCNDKCNLLYNYVEAVIVAATEDVSVKDETSGRGEFKLSMVNKPGRKDP